MYGDRRLGFKLIPIFNISPEHFAKSAVFDVEFMLALLHSGAWIQEDWHPYARFTIAKRLRVHSTTLFDEAFASIRDEFLEYQLEGAGLKSQERIKDHAKHIISNPIASSKQKIVARLMLSTFDNVQFNTLVQPFHWIRLAVALTESDSTFSMALHCTERSKQKLTLCKMLRAV